MSSCSHLAVAQTIDRQRGTVTCSLCGEVVADQQLELDPAFSRGDHFSGPFGGHRQPGFARPMRLTVLASPATHRPSIENARRGMQAIARQLEISTDHVEMAVSLFKLAVNNNVISGGRTPALCACLYAICRRQNTPHMIYDFVDTTKETPYAILLNMKLICRATNTQLYPPDPSLYIQRLTQLLKLGLKTTEITYMALKILRVMHSEWLGYGRRPLGLCGAAVLVAARAFGIDIPVQDLERFVRLSSTTLLLRVGELMKTNAAECKDIDTYCPDKTADAPATKRGRKLDPVYELKIEMKQLYDAYQMLVQEAKESRPATLERCKRWTEFLKAHTEMTGETFDEEKLQLKHLSPGEQLTFLRVEDGTYLDQNFIKEVKEQARQRLIESMTTSQLSSQLVSNVGEKSRGREGRILSTSFLEGLGEEGMLSKGNVPSGTAITAATLALIGGNLANEEDDDEFSFQSGMFKNQVDTVQALFDSHQAILKVSEESAVRMINNANVEILVLPPIEQDLDDQELAKHVITDLEARLKLEKMNRKLFGDNQWDSGAACADEDVRKAELRLCYDGTEREFLSEGGWGGVFMEGVFLGSRKKRNKVKEHANLSESLKHHFRSKGARQINFDSVFVNDEISANNLGQGKGRGMEEDDHKQEWPEDP